MTEKWYVHININIHELNKLIKYLFFADNPCFKKILDNPPPTILVQGAPRPIIINEAVPTCDPQGFYKPKQCNNELCWCVDKMGNEYRNTRGVPDTVNCL